MIQSPSYYVSVSGICRHGRLTSACASAQFDQDLHCPLTELLDTTKCINGEQCSRWYFAHAQNDLNLCILRMLEDTFWLGPSLIIFFCQNNYEANGLDQKLSQHNVQSSPIYIYIYILERAWKITLLTILLNSLIFWLCTFKNYTFYLTEQPARYDIYITAFHSLKSNNLNCQLNGQTIAANTTV